MGAIPADKRSQSRSTTVARRGHEVTRRRGEPGRVLRRRRDQVFLNDW